LHPAEDHSVLYWRNLRATEQIHIAQHRLKGSPQQWIVDHLDAVVKVATEFFQDTGDAGAAEFCMDLPFTGRVFHWYLDGVFAKFGVRDELMPDGTRTVSLLFFDRISSEVGDRPGPLAGIRLTQRPESEWFAELSEYHLNLEPMERFETPRDFTPADLLEMFSRARTLSPDRHDSLLATLRALPANAIVPTDDEVLRVAAPDGTFIKVMRYTGVPILGERIGPVPHVLRFAEYLLAVRWPAR
jgi:hypothetical protein